MQQFSARFIKIDENQLKVILNICISNVGMADIAGGHRKWKQ